jgi:hypothetical protein
MFRQSFCLNGGTPILSYKTMIIKLFFWNEETAMTSSPCKNCPKRFKSKFECAKDCEILKQVQKMQFSLQEQNILSAIDYSEEGRFSVNYNKIYSD